MKRRNMRCRCQDIVRGLKIPSPFDIRELCQRLGTQRGRPILLLPIDLPPESPCGLWVSTDQQDYVFFQEVTSGPHRLQIILHELGHLLCEHHTGPVLSDNTSALLVPDLDPNLIRTVLGRSHYSQVQEREAETIATLILSEATFFSPERIFEVPAETVEVVDRISRSIGY